MGASNFASPENVDNHYVIGLPYEDEEGIYDFDFIEFKEDIANLIEETIYNDLQSKEFKVRVLDCNETTNNRNYPTRYFSNITLTKSYTNGDFELNFLVGYTSAYYEGATLDFHYIDAHGNKMSVDDIIDDIMYTFSYSYDYNEGWLTMMRPNFIKLINKTHSKIKEYFHNLFNRVAQEKVYRVGGFSDGTSIYEKCKD